MRRMGMILTALALVAIMAPMALAQVLGPCGTKTAKVPNAAVKAPPSAAPAGLVISSVPLPGQQAPNFELAAVIGKKVKQIKLSDYDGKWRVVCFYPADFTFV